MKHLEPKDKQSWVFENLSNYGEGGCKAFTMLSRSVAEDMAHEQLRGWYHTSAQEGETTKYLNKSGIMVGQVYSF